MSPCKKRRCCRRNYFVAQPLMHSRREAVHLSLCGFISVRTTLQVVRITSLFLSGALVCAIVPSSSILADDWPQWLGPQHDAVWRETGIVEKFPTGGPPVRWRTPIGGGYTGPAVANGKVYVTDRQLPEGASNPRDPFQRGTIPGTERVLCLNEADGKVIWSHDFKKDFGIPTPLWGFSAHPLLDGNKLICLAGGEGSTVVAYDKDSGKELWRALTAKEPGYC